MNSPGMWPTPLTRWQKLTNFVRGFFYMLYLNWKWRNKR